MRRLGIRFAVPSDIPRLVEMGMRFHRETHYSDLIIVNPESMRATGTRLIEGEDSEIIIALLDGEIVGMLGLFVYPHPLSGEMIAGELFWWVEPEYRGNTGMRLLRAAERWARNMGARRLQMIAPTAAMESLYERLKFTKVEVNYQKELR